MPANCPFDVNHPPLSTCAPAEPLGPPFAHYPNKNLSCRMVTGPGGMPFVRCDNFVPQFDGTRQPSNNNSASFGGLYSNVGSLPPMQVSSPSTVVSGLSLSPSSLGHPGPVARTVSPVMAAAPQHSMWMWGAAIALVALLLVAAWYR